MSLWESARIQLFLIIGGSVVGAIIIIILIYCCHKRSSIKKKKIKAENERKGVKNELDQERIRTGGNSAITAGVHVDSKYVIRTNGNSNNNHRSVDSRKSINLVNVHSNSHQHKNTDSLSNVKIEDIYESRSGHDIDINYDVNNVNNSNNNNTGHESSDAENINNMVNVNYNNNESGSEHNNTNKRRASLSQSGTYEEYRNRGQTRAMNQMHITNDDDNNNDGVHGGTSGLVSPKTMGAIADLSLMMERDRVKTVEQQFSSELVTANKIKAYNDEVARRKVDYDL